MKKISYRGEEGLSMWMFMSPSMILLEDREQREVRRSWSSTMKAGCGLGGW